MFSAIFGNIFGSSVTDETITNSTSTTTTCHSAISKSSSSNISEASTQTQVNLDTTLTSFQTPGPATVQDNWVIVEDDVEINSLNNDKACGPGGEEEVTGFNINDNNVEMKEEEEDQESIEDCGNEAITHNFSINNPNHSHNTNKNNTDLPSLPSMEDNSDVLIGSFFSKNETELDNDIEDLKEVKFHNSNCRIINNTTTTARSSSEIKKKSTRNLAKHKSNDMKSWLITPLPCLETSIVCAVSAAQQQSMIENDQIENLRIERPDKFMSASMQITNTDDTSNNMNLINNNNNDKSTELELEVEEEVSANIVSVVVETQPLLSRRQSMKGRPSMRYKKTYAEVTQQEDVVELKSLFDMHQPDHVAQPQLTTTSTITSTTTPLAAITTLVLFEPLQAITTAAVATPIRNEKRKEKSSSPSYSLSPSMESPQKISRKSGHNPTKKAQTSSLKFVSCEQRGSKKVNKKQNKVLSANKENTEMKSKLILAEYSAMQQSENSQKGKKCGGVNGAGRYGQMLRANKSSSLSAVSGNSRQRKFHNLQQPSFTVSHGVKF